MKGDPPPPLGVFESGGAYISQRALLLGLWKVMALEPKVPSFILSNFISGEVENSEGKEKWTTEMCSWRVCMCVCVCL